MVESQPGPTAYDDLLDRLLAGAAIDVEEAIRLHPELTSEETRALRTLAFARGPGQPDLEEIGSGAGLPFDRIGDFRLLRKLGAGSIGMVFLAEQSSLPRLVAVKLLRPGLALSREADARLSREAQALARLQHPGIVTALAYGQDHGVHYLAMEYVAGRGLDEILADARAGGSRPTAVQVTSWCRDVARALQAAHEAGIIHRDVKPSNIRITPEGRAVLVDFGLALDRPDSTLTTAGAFRGSPRYSSPEQIDPHDLEIDARTDVYSLGVTLYEAITLQPPFRGPTTEAVFARILAGDAVPPTKVAPDTPREVETVILAAIERDRERRYPDAHAFARDLDALLELRDILARPPGLVRRVRKWVRRRPLAAACAGAMVLALLTAASVMGVRGLADRRAFAREAVAASEAAARGAFDDAVAAWDRALGVKPADSGALAGRGEAVRMRDRSRGATLVSEARDLLSQARAARERADQIEGEVERLRDEGAGRTLEVEEGRILARGEGRALAFRLDQETAFHAAVNRAHSALALLPEAPEPHEMLADLYMERWRESMQRGDAARRRSYEALVSEHDRTGRYRGELDGPGVVSFDLTPAGASVHLFRYEEQAQVIADGERRLVPVPVNDAPAPVPPGTWCLRVLEQGGGLEEDDLIFEMEGRRVEGTVFVLVGKPPIEAFDVLVSVDGRAVEHFVNLVYLIDEGDKPARKKSLVFEGRNGRYTVEAATFEELGVIFGGPTQGVGMADFEAKVWSRGATRNVRLPKGILVRTTAAPLFLSPQCRLEDSPSLQHSLKPGSYLAHVSHPGFESQRVPFVVERGERIRVEARLRPAGTTPRGFVYVPAGEARLGRPHAIGSGSIVAAPRRLPGFAIADHEVTVGEFLRFLNARDVRDEWKRKPEQLTWNRTRGLSMWSHLERTTDGKFEVDREPVRDLAAGGVTFLQAEAYAKWMTARYARTARPFEFAIPTDLEWEKAARGADGRAYGYGNVFHPLWQSSGRSRIRMTPERVISFPVDESPYGVHDMTGGQLEWCDRSEATRDPGSERTLRGTAWSMADERPLFREIELPMDVAVAEGGFRLVIRDVVPASRPAADSRPESR